VGAVIKSVGWLEIVRSSRRRPDLRASAATLRRGELNMGYRASRTAADRSGGRRCGAFRLLHPRSPRPPPLRRATGASSGRRDPEVAGVLVHVDAVREISRPAQPKLFHELAEASNLRTSEGPKSSRSRGETAVWPQRSSDPDRVQSCRCRRRWWSPSPAVGSLK